MPIITICESTAMYKSQVAFQNERPTQRLVDQNANSRFTMRSFFNQSNIRRTMGGKYLFFAEFFPKHKQGQDSRVHTKYCMAGNCFSGMMRHPDPVSERHPGISQASYRCFCRCHWQIRRRYVAFSRGVPSTTIGALILA
jgi:hypothetical protein